MLRTGQLLHPASTPAFRPTPGASLPGTLASPRTGLAPAGCRELVARLLMRSPSSWRPELLDAHQSQSLTEASSRWKLKCRRGPGWRWGTGKGLEWRPGRGRRPPGRRSQGATARSAASRLPNLRSPVASAKATAPKAAPRAQTACQPESRVAKGGADRADGPPYEVRRHVAGIHAGCAPGAAGGRSRSGS